MLAAWLRGTLRTNRVTPSQMQAVALAGEFLESQRMIDEIAVPAMTQYPEANIELQEQ